MSAAGSFPGVTLVLGGARSGKSLFAESLVSDAAAQCVYVATAERVDDEMANRIEAHCARRGQAWRTVEAPIELAQAIGRGKHATDVSAGRLPDRLAWQPDAPRA